MSARNCGNCALKGSCTYENGECFLVPGDEPNRWRPIIEVESKKPDPFCPRPTPSDETSAGGRA